MAGVACGVKIDIHFIMMQIFLYMYYYKVMLNKQSLLLFKILRWFSSFFNTWVLFSKRLRYAVSDHKYWQKQCGLRFLIQCFKANVSKMFAVWWISRLKSWLKNYNISHFLEILLIQILVWNHLSVGLPKILVMGTPVSFTIPELNTSI